MYDVGQIRRETALERRMILHDGVKTGGNHIVRSSIGILLMSLTQVLGNSIQIAVQEIEEKNCHSSGTYDVSVLLAVLVFSYDMITDWREG
jgi:hypothetical protein